MDRTTALGLLLLLSASVFAGDYYAQDILEPDKIGTAWMIIRFVDPAARFCFVPRDSVVSGAISFDMPTSKYRRYPRFSATMSVVRFHAIKDLGAVRIAGLIDEIELGFWGEEKSTEAQHLSERIMKLVEIEKEPKIVVDKSFRILDSLANPRGGQTIYANPKSTN